MYNPGFKPQRDQKISSAPSHPLIVLRVHSSALDNRSWGGEEEEGEGRNAQNRQICANIMYHSGWLVLIIN